MRLPLTLLAALIAASFIASSCRDILPAGPKDQGKPPTTQNSGDTIVHWKFNGDLVDASGNGHAGTGTVFGVGNINYDFPDRFHNGQSQAVSMVGKCVVNAYQMPEFTDSDSYTMSVWANFSLGSDFTFMEGSSEFFRAGASLPGCGPLSANMIPKEDLYQWHLLTLTVSAQSVATIYIDSVSLVSKQYGTFPSPGAAGLMLGANENYQADTAHFDDLLVLHHAMTAMEVSARFHEGGWYAHHDTTTPPPPPDTAMHFTVGSSAGIGAIYGMNFGPTPNTGYVCGDYGSVAVTTDNGATWKRFTTGYTQMMYTVCSDVNGVVVAAGNHQMIRTSDGGKTWRLVTLPITGNYIIHDIKLFHTGPDMFAVGSDENGNGVILHSRDDGASWVLSKTTPADLYSVAPAFYLDSYVIAVGDKGQIFWSGDLGATWKDVTAGSGTFTSVSMDQTNKAMGTAVALTADGKTYWSSDHGQSWAEHAGQVGDQFLKNGIYCNGSKTEAWAMRANMGALFHTTDAGQTWKTVQTSIANWNCFAPLNAGTTAYPVAIAGDAGVVCWIK